MKDRISSADPIPVLQESAPPREFPRRTEAPPLEVVVNFYRRMKMNRVYPMVVELKRTTDKHSLASSSPVQIRPVVPGAHVTPALREAHQGNSGAVSTFYVTPLARGRLRDARVGIYQDGRELQEVRLPMKGVTQRMTWTLLALTILLPCLLHYFTTTVDLSQSAEGAKTANATAANVPHKKMLKADEMSAQAIEERLLGQAAGSLAGVANPAPAKKNRPTLGVLEREINANIPEPKESFEEYIPNFPILREPAAHGIQEGYEFLQDWEKELGLSRYLFLVLLGLTAVSWVTHSSRRSRRQATPVAPAA
jgi:hypothetical protein